MNIKEFRQHVRGMVSKRVYESIGEPDYNGIVKDFLDGVKSQGGIKSDNLQPLTELEGMSFVFGENYEFEFGYEVYSRPYVKLDGGDDYNEPRYETLGGNIDFAITSAKVVDKEGNDVCDFDAVAERIQGGYDRIKEWFVFDIQEMIEPLYETKNYPYVIGMSIVEAVNLSRIEKHGKDGFVIVSANRGDVPSSNPRQNLEKPYNEWLKANNLQPNKKNEKMFLKNYNMLKEKELLNDIRSKGYTYSMVYGGYHGTDDVTDVYEPSFVIYNHKKSGDVSDWKELFEFAIEMCGKYRQDSVYVQAPGEAPNYYDANGSTINTSSSKNFKFNRENEKYYTTTKRDKRNPQRFTADIVFEGKYYKPALNHEYVDRMRRNQYGEIFIG